MGAEIDAVEEVLIDQAGVDGMSLADCAKALLAQRDEYRDNLIDLLDSLERGDGYQQRERMTRAGLLLGFARYAEHSDGEADA
jgi:hypothetical protein